MAHLLKIRSLGPDEWRTFREVRLAALQDAPYAFGSTWKSEKDRGEVEWRQAVASRQRFVALQGGRVVGMAAGGESNSTTTAALTSLWVEPALRGGGVGDQLVVAVLAWAKTTGFSKVLLWVTEGNSHAEALYERNGFIRTGEVIDQPRREFEMSVEL
jgi:GNAT superfamily N-acetyltransferase